MKAKNMVVTLRSLIAATSFAALLLASCSKPVSTAEEFQKFAKDHKIGSAKDYMLEMQNMAGEWEPVIFVFGYADDDGTRVECENAADGLRKVNYARTYRCIPAN